MPEREGWRNRARPASSSHEIVSSTFLTQSPYHVSSQPRPYSHSSDLRPILSILSARPPPHPFRLSARGTHRAQLTPRVVSVLVVV
eukprot:286075-Pyramimonas_sp.AAC.1